MRFGSQVPGLARISCVLPALHLCSAAQKSSCHSPGVPELFMLLQPPREGWAQASTDLNQALGWSILHISSMRGEDQTTAALLLGSPDILINGWLPKTWNGMKRGPGYPKMEAGRATFNEIIMNIPRTILPIRRNPSLTICFTAFTFLENAAAVKGWCFL